LLSSFDYWKGSARPTAEMILTRLLAIFLLLSASPLTRFQVAAAPPIPVPDFTGVWKIDRDHSTAKVLRDLEDLTFVISQNSPELHVKRIIKEKKHKERVRELTYFTDGRGEKISFLFGSEKWDSKTKWIDNTLVSRFTITGYIDTNMDFY